MAQNVSLGTMVPNAGPIPERLGLDKMAQLAERAGAGTLWVIDHVVLPTEINSRYPFSVDGGFRFPSDTNWYEVLTSAAWIAAATTTARVGTAVLVLPQRQPVVVAKVAATIAALSGGRFILGAGAGWLEEEFDALGYAFKGRGAVLEEDLKIVKACWSGRATVGPHDIEVDMAPAPEPPIPLLVGGMSKAAVRRAATLGDGWIALTRAADIDTDTLDGQLERLRAEAESSGRSPEELTKVLRIAPDPDDAAVFRAVEQSASLGFDEVSVSPSWESLEQTADFLGRCRERLGVGAEDGTRNRP